MNKKYAVATGLLAFPVAISALAMCGFAFGVSICLWHMPLGVTIALCAAWFLASEDKWRVSAWTLTAIVGSMLVASLGVAYSNADAAGYYRPAIILLADGWNPLRVTEASQIAAMTDGWCRPWPIAFLPRMAWLFGATAYKWCGFCEVADAFNVIVLIASFLVVNEWLHERFGVVGWRLLLLVLALCLSPHVVGGMLGGSFDAAGYSAFLIAFIAADRKKPVPLILAAVIMGGLKFTGVVFAAMVFAARLFLCPKDWRKTVLYGSMSAVLILLLNASPYITSIKNHGGPFYPSHSFVASERFDDDKNPITNDIGRMNDDAREIGYFGRFVWAYVSQNLVKTYYCQKTGRNDFNPDFRVSAGIEGFGSLFRLMLVLSLICWPFIRNRSINVFLGLILATVLIQPTFYSGIARYVPQFYIFPWLVALGIGIRLKGCKSLRYFEWGAGCMLAALSVSVLAYPVSFFALQWIISVQNLQIADAAQADQKVLVVGDWFYFKRAYGTDVGIPADRIVDAATEAETSGMYEYSSYFAYGKVFLSRKIEGFYRLNHVMSLNNPSVKASRNANNMLFFLKEFLPRELPRIPLRVWQTVRLRASQFCRRH